MTDFVTNPNSNDAQLVTAGGLTKSFTVTPTITSGTAYAAGEDIGGLITIASFGRSFFSGNGGSGLIQSVVLTDASAQNASVDIVFFASDPSNTTFTDHSALSIAAADLTKAIGVVHLSDYTTASTSIGQAQNLAIPFVLSATTAYVAIICRGTPTYTSTSALSLIVNVLQD